MWPWCSGELRRESTVYRRLELGGYEEGSVVSDLRGSTNGGTTIKWGVDERSTRNIDLNDYTARSPAVMVWKTIEGTVEHPRFAGCTVRLKPTKEAWAAQWEFALHGVRAQDLGGSTWRTWELGELNLLEGESSPVAKASIGVVQQPSVNDGLDRLDPETCRAPPKVKALVHFRLAERVDLEEQRKAGSVVKLGSGDLNVPTVYLDGVHGQLRAFPRRHSAFPAGNMARLYHAGTLEQEMFPLASESTVSKKGFLKKWQLTGDMDLVEGTDYFTVWTTDQNDDSWGAPKRAVFVTERLIISRVAKLTECVREQLGVPSRRDTLPLPLTGKFQPGEEELMLGAGEMLHRWSASYHAAHRGGEKVAVASAFTWLLSYATAKEALGGLSNTMYSNSKKFGTAHAVYDSPLSHTAWDEDIGGCTACTAGPMMLCASASEPPSLCL